MVELSQSTSRTWTLEVVPAHAHRVDVFNGLVNEIFVTMIPQSETGEVLEAVRTIQARGFTPIPHIAVRNFETEGAYADFLSAIKDLGITRALFLAGGVSNVAGPYGSTLKAFQTPAFAKGGFKTVGVAGHPEGNPADRNSRVSLREKWSFLQDAGIGMEIVTQWSFAPDKVSAYIKDLRAEGITAPVRCGIAGPATLKTLLKYAKICGVSAAKEVIRKQGLSFGRLLMSNKPEQFVSLVEGTPHFHLYPFGGLEKCAEWLRENGAEARISPSLSVGEATPPV